MYLTGIQILPSLRDWPVLSQGLFATLLYKQTRLSDPKWIGKRCVQLAGLRRAAQPRHVDYVAGLCLGVISCALRLARYTCPP
jgi:hypothetical protein